MRGAAWLGIRTLLCGRLGRPAMKLLHLLGDEAASLGGVTRASFVNCALRELSVLAKHLLACWLGQLAPASELA
jgi:hypothetical protein